MTTIIPVISDLQVPLHDKRAVAAVATFVADRNLDSVCVGDACDSTQISRWVKGTAGEHGNLDKDRRETTAVLRELRVRHLSRSNHDDRIETYVRRYAPGLASLPELFIENFLGLDSISCRLHRNPYELTPGWVLVHGDEGSMIQSPGGTALNIAQRFGRSVVCGHCFDDKTQILTPDGWVSHDLLTEDSIVMTMNRESGKGEWQKVEAVYRYSHYRELIQLEGKGLSLAVTEDHGLVTQSRADGSFSYPSAKDVEGKEVKLPLALMHDEEELPITDDAIRVIAWVMAEGEYDHTGSVRISQSDTPKGGIAALESALDGLGVEYSKVRRYAAGTTEHGVKRNYDAYRYGIGVRLRDFLDTYIERGTKNPKRALAGMSSRQGRVFLEEYSLADGSRSSTGNSLQFNSKDNEKIDLAQELAARCGMRSSVSLHCDGHYTLTICYRDAVRVHPGSWSRVPYDGVVWCVSVPNGTLLVRRDGNTAITQNTHKLGVQHKHHSVNGRITQELWGFEVGNLMDMKKASYLKAGHANWSQGFGVLVVDGKDVTPIPIPIRNGKFYFDGKTYKG